MILARICSTRTDFAGIFGVRLFGGSYIICLYIGMLFGKYYSSIISINKRSKCLIAGVFSVITLIVAATIWKNGYFLDSFPLFSSVLNPPGVTEIVYAFLIKTAICFWGLLSDSSSIALLHRSSSCLSYIGRQTLLIFLYHQLFLDYFLNKYCGELNIYVKIPLYYFVMVFGSIAIGYLYKNLYKLIKSSYTLKGE